MAEGFNFRSTSGYVTDGSGETYCIGDTYPVTRGGSTFGWEVALTGIANRTASGDVRLAGINFKGNNGSQSQWRVDLGASGSYDMRLALGDNALRNYQYLQVQDTTTPLFTIDDSGGTAANDYADATGTDYSRANWPGSNAKVTHTFSTTICRVIIGTPSAQTSFTTLAHFFIEAAVGGAAIPTNTLSMMGLGV